MPIHDWTRVDSGVFHDFHQGWTIEIRNALNGGGLPPGYFAMAEQILGGPIPDVVTLQEQKSPVEPAPSSVGLANRITIRHRQGRIIAVVEIVSPGNKSSRHALRSFVAKAVELLRQGIHLLIVDLFPPTPRDPQGIHKAIWDEVRDEPFVLPDDKRLTVAAYRADVPVTAYVDSVSVGDALPSLPIFLDAGKYVPAPLDVTYQAAWAKYPVFLRELVQNVGP